MKKTNILLGYLGLIAFMTVPQAYSADNNSDQNNARILFKIHDISPEKDVNGNVTGCNISATFFNNYDKALSNTQVILTWNDETIDEIINQEEYELKETLHRNPEASRSRYPTSKTTTPNISANIKIPLINAHQQISLKNKVSTDRCFILMNDMEIKINSCTFAGEAASDRGCKASFVYISPQDPQYFSEFKEISYEEELTTKENEISKELDETNSLYDEIITNMRKIGK